VSTGRRKASGRSYADRPYTVALISLGCPKNLVDSEKILAHLGEAGFVLVADPPDADIIVVNTCGFLQAAKREAMSVLEELGRLKAAHPDKRLVVVGCLVQREGRNLLNEAPFVDAIAGVHQRDRIADIVRAVAFEPDRDGRLCRIGRYRVSAKWSDRGRLRLTPRGYAYLRISEGCDQKCTFCTIPAIRGPYRSKPVDEVLAEAAELVADGAYELVVIGQDTTSYGRDIGFAEGLAGLLRRLNDLEGVGWIRLMYTYPREFDERVIAALAECGRVVKYVDLPLQHINDRILRLMGRRITRRRTERLLKQLRSAVPGIAIRTTFIVGFPGENEEHFQELLEFVEQQRFDAVGAFVFSPEPGTPAARMSDQVPEDEKHQRLEQLMLAQQRIAFEKAAQFVGRRFEVLVDGPADRLGTYLARHAQQAPEVDSVTLVRTRKGLNAGDVILVECTATRGYDLLAKPVRGAQTNRAS